VCDLSCPIQADLASLVHAPASRFVAAYIGGEMERTRIIVDILPVSRVADPSSGSWPLGRSASAVCRELLAAAADGRMQRGELSMLITAVTVALPGSAGTALAERAEVSVALPGMLSTDSVALNMPSSQPTTVDTARAAAQKSIETTVISIKKKAPQVPAVTVVSSNSVDVIKINKSANVASTSIKPAVAPTAAVMLPGQVPVTMTTASAATSSPRPVATQPDMQIVAIKRKLAPVVPGAL
jgi:hypothetical protein